MPALAASTVGLTMPAVFSVMPAIAIAARGVTTDLGAVGLAAAAAGAASATGSGAASATGSGAAGAASATCRSLLQFTEFHQLPGVYVYVFSRCSTGPLGSEST